MAEMEMTEHHDDARRELHIHTRITDEAIKHASFDIKNVIYRQITEEIVHELMPEVRAYVMRNLDYANLAKMVETSIQAALLNQMIGSLTRATENPTSIGLSVPADPWQSPNWGGLGKTPED